MKRSKHSLSNTKLLSGNMGKLIPIGLMEVLPGDTIQQATNLLVRCSPLMTPVMHPVYCTIEHFFVPHRLVWDDWENFITGGPDGANASVAPTITFPQNGPEIGTLADYLGVPVDNPQAAGTTVSALPFRGYAKIWNEFYRDQDLETALTIDTTDGPDTTTSVLLQNVDWERDYFTGARPWTQKGPEVTMPLGTKAYTKWDSFAGGAAEDQYVGIVAAAGADTAGYGATIGGALTNLTDGTSHNIYADLSSATSASINQLREAYALQRYEEARARYGSRYTEYLRYLGIRSSDARLQRPERLGSGRQVIQFSEVLQTGVDSLDGGVGNLRGHGMAAVRSNRYRRYFEEHGYVFSLLSVKPKTMYSQGIPRHFLRTTKEDYWQKELQFIGQQEIYNKEIYAAHATPNGVFGYIDRYDEYRRIPSTIAGEFRSVLDEWHFGRLFGSEPTLNGDFVKCVPTEEPFAVDTQDVLWIMAAHSIQARRLVAKHGIPN